MRPELAAALDELSWCIGGAPPALPSEGLSDLTATEIKTLQASRVGQGRFRMGVAAYWQACSVTGCMSLQLLAASHIKPWSASTNAERLDPYNGLLLTPNLHTLFDVGLISFADDGTILVSRRADPSALHSFHVISESRITRLTSAHIKYLKYHRKHVFLR
jgi:putative restriction endonuclease